LEDLTTAKVLGALLFKKYLGKPVNLKGEEFTRYYDLVLSARVVRRDLIPPVAGLRLDLGFSLPVRRLRVRRVRVVLRL
jgi:hypothetical protein